MSPTDGDGDGDGDGDPDPRQHGRAVLYRFCLSRAGEHARTMLGDFQGVLVTDDYAGYKALYAAGRVTEAGCWAACTAQVL